ncbi:5663_t:CDS:2 [Diversispora eburnea]|uniref:Protein PNS1 n=1 Tax=Diversispora eburnea TaxID=1213867 RepID=A0A9N8UUL8_9GLOM|nr:5663_t:CDS:2 [Diversispora eburnea]
MLAGVVSEWYFYRHEPNYGPPEEISMLSLKRATTISFVYAGITCESFWDSALITTKLFSRNLIFGLINGSIVIGLLCGFASLNYASHYLNSPYGYVVGLITGIIPFRIVKFYADFIMDTIDASFICYAIDLDVNKIHSNEVHESFSNFQIQ